VGSEAEGDAGELLDKDRTQPSVAVVGGDGVRQRPLLLVALEEARDELGPEVRPELFFGEEVLRAAWDAEDADACVAGVGVGLTGELGPLWVDDLAGHYVHLVP
jgi:hypothetical protein